MERGRLVKRAHHIRRSDSSLERDGTFGSARNETRLERFVVVFEGENENTRIFARFHEAIGAFFLQKCSQRLTAGLYDKLRELTRRNSTPNLSAAA